MIGETDAGVIARSLQEPERFEVVFDRHFSTIHRYLRRRVGIELAEEIAAETFVQAFRGRRRFAGAEVGSALPWLYGIAANLLRMHRRTEERRLRAYSRAASRGSETAASELDVDGRLDAAGLGPALADALAALSPVLREVLLLHAWAELSHEEIASALGLSGAAVRTRLHRARTQVSESLAVPHESERRTRT